MITGVFNTKWLARFTRRERITDESLREAIDRAERGIVDADLSGGLIKQRVAREGQGRSGGYRMMVAFRREGRAVFLYGFAKNEQENIGQDGAGLAAGDRGHVAGCGCGADRTGHRGEGTRGGRAWRSRNLAVW